MNVNNNNMKTNFFSELSLLTDNYDVNLSITKENGEITVGIYPKCKADAKMTFPPLILTGTIAELDEMFFDKIANAMKRTCGIMTNIGFYAKQMQQKEEQTKAKATVTAAKKTATVAAKAGTKPAPSLLDTPKKEEKEVEEEEESEEETETLFPTTEKE